MAADDRAETVQIERELTRALAAWGTTSAISGLLIRGLGAATASPFLRGFGGQTAGWGVIDAGIAAVGIWRRSTTPDERTPEQAERLRRLLDLNAKADIGYIAATYVLDLAPAGTRVFGRPEALRSWNEKTSVLRFPHLAPPSLLTRSMAEIRRFQDEVAQIEEESFQ